MVWLKSNFERGWAKVKRKEARRVEVSRARVRPLFSRRLGEGMHDSSVARKYAPLSSRHADRAAPPLLAHVVFLFAPKGKVQGEHEREKKAIDPHSARADLSVSFLLQTSSKKDTPASLDTHSRGLLLHPLLSNQPISYRSPPIEARLASSIFQVSSLSFPPSLPSSLCLKDSVSHS